MILKHFISLIIAISALVITSPVTNGHLLYPLVTGF